jgi:hypothetical protein
MLIFLRGNRWRKRKRNRLFWAYFLCIGYAYRHQLGFYWVAFGKVIVSVVFSNCLGRSRLEPKMLVDHHTSPIFSSSTKLSAFRFQNR